MRAPTSTERSSAAPGAIRWIDPSAAAVREHLLLTLDRERAACVPERNEP